MKSSLNFVTPLILVCFVFNGCSSAPERKTYTPHSEAKPAAQRVSVLKKAQAQYGKGDYTSAIETLNSIQEKDLKDSERSEYWNLKGLIRLGEKSPEAAEIDFRHALDSNVSPEYASYYQYNLASSLHEEGKQDLALKQLNGIDTATMDQNDQKKVSALREKITQGDHGAPADATPLTPGVLVASSPSPAPSASPSATPVIEVYTGPTNASRIGLLLPLSGKYESFGKKVQKSIELAFQTSLDPKVKSYELVPVDSGDTAASHLDALRKLVEEEKVIAIIGPLLSKGVEALPEKAAYYQVPLISIAQVQGSLSSSLFSCSISTKDQATKMADYAVNVRGFKHFAILAPTNKAGEEMANAFWDEVKTKGGDVRAFELYDPEVTDFREPVDKTIGLHYTETRAKELKDLADKRKELDITKKTMKTIQYFELPPIIDFDAVFIADEAKTVGQIIPTFAYRNAKNLSYLGITTWNSTQLITRSGDQAEGAVFPVSFNTLSPPVETKRFYDLYNATYASFPGELDAIAFDAAAVAIKALNENPNTREEFKFKLETLGNVEGATGMISMQDHRCSRNLALYTVKKGKFQVLPDNGGTPVATENADSTQADETPTPNPITDDSGPEAKIRARMKKDAPKQNPNDSSDMNQE